jgi:uncharacterized protein (DUF58 family)
VPGVALMMLGVGAATWVLLAAHGARLQRQIGVHSVEEDQSLEMMLTIEPGLLPPPGVELDDALAADVPALGRARRVRIEASFARRGRRNLPPSRLVIRDPLGLAQRTISSDPFELLVLPRIVPIVAADESGGGNAGVTEGGAIAVQGAELELDSLRPYRAGAPASRIHWPTVARTGEMMERRLVADADSRPLVVLDPRRPESEEALDKAVRAAASLTVYLARTGGCSLLLPGDRRATEVEADLRSWSPLHARLALLEAGGAPPFAGRLERAGAILWVNAAATATPPPGLARAAAAGRYLVTPLQQGRPAEFAVADCFAYKLGARAGARKAA